MTTTAPSTIACPRCGSRVAVTAAQAIEVHFHYDGIPCGASGASAKRAIRAESLKSRKG